MTIKIGINGMGRIGRMILRAIVENNYKNIEIKHINNRSNSEISSSLLKYDSIHGKFNAEIGFDKNHLIINKNKISFGQETNIKDITPSLKRRLSFTFCYPLLPPLVAGTTFASIGHQSLVIPNAFPVQRPIRYLRPKSYLHAPLSKDDEL